MRNKITTTAQLQQLHEGDTVIKYPVNGETEPHYDETQTERAQLYTISAVNKDNDMVYLITTQPRVCCQKNRATSGGFSYIKN